MTKFQDILTREMSRKEFLKYVGVVILSVIGVNALLKSLNPVVDDVSAYGGGSFGSKKGGLG